MTSNEVTKLLQDVSIQVADEAKAILTDEKRAEMFAEVMSGGSVYHNGNEQAEQDSSPVYCPMCGSGDASYMGALGYRQWLRCNECGSDFSHMKETAQ